MRRSERLVPILLTAVLAGCFGSHSTDRPTARELTAIRTVMLSPAWKAARVEQLFPEGPISVPCILGGGPGAPVTGTCETRVTLGPHGSAVVSFVETWDGRLSHTWEFEVDASKHVGPARSFGDSPPQLVK